VIPAQFRVIVTHRPRYACRACKQAVVVAPAPERLIKGGLHTEAMVGTSWYPNTPGTSCFTGQPQMLAAQDIKRAVLAFWVGYAAAELKPLFGCANSFWSPAIAIDETMGPVLDPSRGRTKKGFFWATARDDPPWGGTDPPTLAMPKKWRRR
jgi:transposase